MAVAGAGSCASSKPAQAPPVATANVSLTPLVPPSYAYEDPASATDPRNASHVAVAFVNEGQSQNQCFVAVTTDGAKTWTVRAVIGVVYAISPSGVPPSEYSMASVNNECAEPQVAFDGQGNLYLVYQDAYTDGSGCTMFIEKSAGGTDFGPPRQLDPELPASQGACDGWPTVTYDAQTRRLYLTWVRYPVPADPEMCCPGFALMAHSDDQGASFSPPVQVSPASMDDKAVTGPVVAVDGAGDLFVAYGPADVPSYALDPLEVAVSRDGGATFTEKPVGQTPVNACQNVQKCPHLAVSPPDYTFVTSPGSATLYLAWWGDSGPGALSRITFSSSTDGGTTWTHPQTLGVPPGASQDQQHRPWLVAGPHGDLDLVYCDLQPGRSENVYWIRSADGGSTWSVPLKVSDAPHNPYVGPNGQYFDPLEGVGITAALSGSTLVVAWPDSRRGTSDTLHQDLEVGSVRNAA